MATLELVLEKLQVVLEKNEKLEKVNEKIEKEVSQLRAEVKYLSEKLDQQPQSPSPTATSTTTTAAVARWTGGELTPNDKKSIQEKSKFSCSIRLRPPCLNLRSGRPIGIRFSKEVTQCTFMDVDEGEYMTPIGGKYEFGLHVTLFGDAMLKFFLVSTKMGWRREILTARKEKNKKKEDGEKGEGKEKQEETEEEGKEKQEETEEEGKEKQEETEEEENKKEEEALNASFETEYDYGEYFDFSGDDVGPLSSDDFISENGTVVVDCKEFVDVCIEVVQMRGCPRDVCCVFSGKLIDFA